MADAGPFASIDTALLSVSPWARFWRWLRWQWVRACGQGEVIVGMDFGRDQCSVEVRRWPDGTLEVVREEWWPMVGTAEEQTVERASERP